MARVRKPLFFSSNARTGVPKVKWNQVIYDRVHEVEKCKESTRPQKPLRLGTKRTLRSRMRAFRVRVSKLRVRIRISPLMWLQKFCDAYVRMMMGAEEKLGGRASGIVMGFHNTYAITDPRRR